MLMPEPVRQRSSRPVALYLHSATFDQQQLEHQLAIIRSCAAMVGDVIGDGPVYHFVEVEFMSYSRRPELARLFACLERGCAPFTRLYVAGLDRFGREPGAAEFAVSTLARRGVLVVDSRRRTVALPVRTSNAGN